MAGRFKIPYLQMILLIRKMNGLFVTDANSDRKSRQKTYISGLLSGSSKKSYIDDVSITKDDVSITGRSFYRDLAWVWIIMIGALMITPDGIECIACGFVLTKKLGVISVVFGITGLVIDRIPTLVGR
jgi:hypothetical protein